MSPSNKTPQKMFRPPILAALRSHGGRASIRQVYLAVERDFEEQFLPGDHLPVDKGEPRWKNAVRQEARKLRDEGVLVQSAHRGSWQLSTSAL